MRLNLCQIGEVQAHLQQRIRCAHSKSETEPGWRKFESILRVAVDAADLFSKVCSHHVDVVRKVLPCAGYFRHNGLVAELSVPAHFAGHTCHFSGEGVEAGLSSC